MSSKKRRTYLPKAQAKCQHCMGRGLVSVVAGDVLRAHRVSLGWSLRAFAAHLGFTPPYVSDVELGRRRATEAIVEAYETAPVAP